jgi:hypothetical protein
MVTGGERMGFNFEEDAAFVHADKQAQVTAEPRDMGPKQPRARRGGLPQVPQGDVSAPPEIRMSLAPAALRASRERAYAPPLLTK